MALVSRKELAKEMHISERTLKRRLPEFEHVGDGPTPPGKIKVHMLAGRGCARHGYDLERAKALIEQLESERRIFRTSNRFRASPQDWQFGNR